MEFNMALLLHLNDVDEKQWASSLSNTLAPYRVLRRNDTYDAKDINYIFVWKVNDNVFDNLPNLKAIFSLGAGVDALLKHKKLPKNVPIVRFIDKDLSQCMSDYVIAHVLMHHRLFSHYNSEQKKQQWQQYFPPPASERNVGIMGLGELGLDAIERLKPLGFSLNGWSNSSKNIKGVKAYVGTSEFNEFLTNTDILVNLLPLTKQTKHILNYKNFKKLKRSRNFTPVIINAARGGHQKETEIIKALNDGTLGAASLDVFETEPLPKNSPLWSIENCYITPHIAAISNVQTGVKYFAKILTDHENNKPLINLVDIKKGY